ncbi:hypothetical protein F5X97DRAFT_310390 [Nemania serpens]|nr:hypothetical protein F5X97DRAFT_310390 [Nemania serpens]
MRGAPVGISIPFNASPSPRSSPRYMVQYVCVCGCVCVYVSVSVRVTCVSMCKKGSCCQGAVGRWLRLLLSLLFIYHRPPQPQLELEGERDMGALDESLRLLSTEVRFSGDDERRGITAGHAEAWEVELALGSGDVWRFWKDLYISLHRCADIVYVGDMTVLIWSW